MKKWFLRFNDKSIHIVEGEDWRDEYFKLKARDKEHYVVDVWPYKDKLPIGWKKIDGSIAPNGYYWANNCKSRFGGEYEYALIKEKLE